MSTGYLRFLHKFSRTVSCELRVPDRAPPPGSRNVLSIEWTGHNDAYRQWVLATNQILANRWGISMLYALGTHRNRTELWEFTPGGTPKLIEKLKAGL